MGYLCCICPYETERKEDLWVHMRTSPQHLQQIIDLLEQTSIQTLPQPQIFEESNEETDEDLENPLEATCEICEITFMTMEKRDAHLTSKRHKRTVMKLSSASTEKYNLDNTKKGGFKEENNVNMHVEVEIMETIEEIAKEIVLIEQKPILVKINTPNSNTDEITESIEERDINLTSTPGIYKCQLCNFETKYSQNLSAHFNTLKHINNKESQTNELNNQHNNLDSAKKQLQPGEENKLPFRCDVCNFETKFNSNLKVHFTTQKHITKCAEKSNDASFVDDLNYGQNKDVTAEIRNELNSSSNSFYRCDVCNFETKYSYNLIAHFKTQKHLASAGEETNFETSKIEDEIDDMTTDENADTSQELNNSTDSSYNCDVCQFKTGFVKSWISHINSRLHKDALKEDIEIYQEILEDEIDDKNEEMKEILNASVKLTRNNEENGENLVERVNIPVLSELNDQERHNPSLGQNSRKTVAFQCPLCTAVFGFKFNIKRHFKKAHPGDVFDSSKIISTKFMCYECQWGKFETYQSLELHFSHAHHGHVLNPEKVYLGDTKVRASSFQSVRRISSTEFPSFSNEAKNNISQESESKASGEFLYKCEPCNFETKYNGNLHAHFRSSKHINNIESKKEQPLKHNANDQQVPEDDKEMETDQEEAEVEEDENLVGSTCNFKGKNRTSFRTHWTRNPDCQRDEFMKIRSTSNDKNTESELRMSIGSGMHRCEICNFETKYSQNLTAHYETKKHIASCGGFSKESVENTDNRESVDDERIDFDSSQNGEVIDAVDKESRKWVSTGIYKCDICNFETKYSQNLTAHYETKKHIANFEKLSNEGVETAESRKSIGDESANIMLIANDKIEGEIETESRKSVGTGLHRCDICKFETKYSQNLLAHFRSQKHISNTIGITKDTLNNHVTDVILSKNDVTVEHSKENIDELEPKEGDINSVQIDDSLVCPTCNFKGKNRKSIAVHWNGNPNCKANDEYKSNASGSIETIDSHNEIETEKISIPFNDQITDDLEIAIDNSKPNTEQEVSLKVDLEPKEATDNQETIETENHLEDSEINEIEKGDVVTIVPEVKTSDQNDDKIETTETHELPETTMNDKLDALDASKNKEEVETVKDKGGHPCSICNFVGVSLKSLRIHSRMKHRKSSDSQQSNATDCAKVQIKKEIPEEPMEQMVNTEKIKTGSNCDHHLFIDQSDSADDDYYGPYAKKARYDHEDIEVIDEIIDEEEEEDEKTLEMFDDIVNDIQVTPSAKRDDNLSFSASLSFVAENLSEKNLEKKVEDVPYATNHNVSKEADNCPSEKSKALREKDDLSLYLEDDEHKNVRFEQEKISVSEMNASTTLGLVPTPKVVMEEGKSLGPDLDNNDFFCKLCDYHTDSQLILEHHQNQAEHINRQKAFNTLLSEKNNDTNNRFHCENCDFSSYHQDVVKVHQNQMHSPLKKQQENQGIEYCTIQEKTLRMCCAHCQFITKDLDAMMKHNKSEHPEL